MPRFSTEEIDFLERQLLSNDLDAKDLVNVLDSLRSKYCREVPYKPLLTTPELLGYTREANAALGRVIFKVAPVLSLSKFVQHRECVALDLREFIFAREESRREPHGLAAILHRAWQSLRGTAYCLPRPDEKHTIGEYVDECIKAQQVYDTLCEGSQRSLSQGIECADWAAADMLYLPQRAPLPQPLAVGGPERNAMDLLKATAPDMILVSLREAVIDSVTGEIVSSKMYAKH